MKNFTMSMVFAVSIFISYFAGTMMPMHRALASDGCCPCQCPCEQPAAPQPAAPQPTAPQPTAPQPAAPQRPAPQPAAPQPAQSKPAAPATQKININTATIAELDTIPGVGPVIAQRIIEARPYYNSNDLLNVKGIGEKTLAKMLPFIIW